MKREMRRENNEYMSHDDLLRDALSELTDALMALDAMRTEGASHIEYNVLKVSECIMKAGRIISRVRGVRYEQT